MNVLTHSSYAWAILGTLLAITYQLPAINRVSFLKTVVLILCIGSYVTGTWLEFSPNQRQQSPIFLGTVFADRESKEGLTSTSGEKIPSTEFGSVAVVISPQSGTVEELAMKQAERVFPVSEGWKNHRLGNFNQVSPNDLSALGLRYKR